MGERKKEKKDQTNIFTCENQWDNKRERERENTGTVMNNKTTT